MFVLDAEAQRERELMDIRAAQRRKERALQAQLDAARAELNALRQMSVGARQRRYCLHCRMWTWHQIEILAGGGERLQCVTCTKTRATEAE